MKNPNQLDEILENSQLIFGWIICITTGILCIFCLFRFQIFAVVFALTAIATCPKFKIPDGLRIAIIVISIITLG